MSLFSIPSIVFDPLSGTINGVTPQERRLSDLKGYFSDSTAYSTLLSQSNPVIYSVSGVEPAQGDGQMHYGIGVIASGQVGAEYFMTKGHFHAWRPAAEVYIGLSGEGCMLLEDESTGEEKLLPLNTNNIVYVPGFTAHRTINTGNTPLVYIGIYPAAAGHDYGLIAVRNFQSVLINVGGQPTLLKREQFSLSLSIAP